MPFPAGHIESGGRRGTAPTYYLICTAKKSAIPTKFLLQFCAVCGNISLGETTKKQDEYLGNMNKNYFSFKK